MRREVVDIEAKILSRTFSEATKSKIIRSVNLSGEGATKYLERLVKRRLLEFDEETHLYRITQSGLEFLRLYRDLIRLRLG